MFFTVCLKSKSEEENVGLADTMCVFCVKNGKKSREKQIKLAYNDTFVKIY